MCRRDMAGQGVSHLRERVRSCLGQHHACVTCNVGRGRNMQTRKLCGRCGHSKVAHRARKSRRRIGPEAIDDTDCVMVDLGQRGLVDSDPTCITTQSRNANLKR